MKKVFTLIFALCIMRSIIGVGYAAYETEEVPVELILTLIETGFKQSEDDESIWEASVEDDYHKFDHSITYAWFNIEENFGISSCVGYDDDGNIVGVYSGAYKWNAIEGEFEILGLYD